MVVYGGEPEEEEPPPPFGGCSGGAGGADSLPDRADGFVEPAGRWPPKTYPMKIKSSSISAADRTRPSAACGAEEAGGVEAFITGAWFSSKFKAMATRRSASICWGVSLGIFPCEPLPTA